MGEKAKEALKLQFDKRLRLEWTAPLCQDRQGQEGIKSIVDQYGRDNLIVVLGAPDADSAELYAETVTNGDPSWVGPLAGVALKLPVYHIMEDTIKSQINPKCYQEHLALMEMALEVDKISQALAKVRENSQTPQMGEKPLYFTKMVNEENRL